MTSNIITIQITNCYGNSMQLRSKVFKTLEEEIYSYF